MQQTFITSIDIQNVRNITEFKIELCDSARKHLIITGKNGTGKTSLLLALKQFLGTTINGAAGHYDKQTEKLKKEEIETERDNLSSDELNNLKNRIKDRHVWFKQFGGIRIFYNNIAEIPPAFHQGNFIIAFFGAKRDTNLNVPTGINKIDFNPAYDIDVDAGKVFIQHIVNLKADRSFARDDGDDKAISAIDKWFTDFEKSLQLIFSLPIQLKFDRSQYNFLIQEEGKTPYNLNQLSDGYSAMLDIVTELIIRMENHNISSYNVQGIVLIDEIETHLHVDMQKKVLPFLTSFFPAIQFIVTTHSPFVLSSIDNAVICDLEKKFVTCDLSGYSYDTLIESYFDSDKYSNHLKDKISKYEQLLSTSELNDVQSNELRELERYINEIPKFVSDELAVKVQQIRLQNLRRSK